MNRKSLSYYIGTALIVLSVVGLVFTFYPLISIYVFPSPLPQAVSAQEDEFRLTIPKISATGEVIENIDPYNQSEYNEALQKGIAHAKGTHLPDEGGTVFLFAHSSGLPWQLTRYNTIFLRLNELDANDQITIQYNNKKYVYSVRETKEVWPHEIQYLRELEKDQLILQTCTPIGTDFKRLLIFADPVR